MTGEPVALATRFAFGYLVNSQGFIKDLSTALLCCCHFQKRFALLI